MVVALQTLIALINARKNKALLLAESSLPESQFKAYRKIFLMEFGEKGLEGELQKLYAEQNKEGRNGQEYIVHERGCHYD